MILPWIVVAYQGSLKASSVVTSGYCVVHDVVKSTISEAASLSVVGQGGENTTRYFDARYYVLISVAIE